MKVGRDTAPTADDPVEERLRWIVNAWQTALLLTRLERMKDRPRDLRNDAIDAVHYSLAATFCSRIAVREWDMSRIRELLPEPRLPFLKVDVKGGGVLVRPAA